MSKYICQICGYVYDEENEKVKFDELPPDWKCPLCGAPKDQFKKAEEEAAPAAKAAVKAAERGEELRGLSDGETAALFSNLARGCEKQYKAEASALYTKLAEYYTNRTALPQDAGFGLLADRIDGDLENEFVSAKAAAEAASDRGAKRVLTWSEKVSRMTGSILERYEKEGDAMIENTKLWVCDICGFIYIGDVPPAVCPICKVPSFKILEVART